MQTNTFLQTLTTNWHLMRWIRLIFGLFIGVQAILMHDALSGFLASIFLFQAVTNTGCCGSNGCSAPASRSKGTKQASEDVSYEEVQ